MTSNNIFISLSKYKPSEKVDPKENRLTEFFAFLLDQNKKLCLYFIEEGLKHSHKKGKTINLGKIDSDNLIISTQHTTQDEDSFGYIDLKITDKNNTITLDIENKINSSVFLEQLSKYRKHQKKKKKKKNYLWLITMPNEDKVKFKKFVYVHLYWYEVYEILSNFRRKETGELERLLINQFLEYMEGLNMKTFEGFTALEKQKIWVDFLTFSEKAIFILENIIRLKIKKKVTKIKAIEKSRDNIYISIIPANISSENKWKKLYKGIYLGFCCEVDPKPYPCAYVSVDMCNEFHNRLVNSRNYDSIKKSLKRREFDLENLRYIEKVLPLSNLPSDKNDQLKKITDFYIDSFRDLESSGLISLLKRYSK